MALALPEDGKIYACDINTDYASVGATHSPLKVASQLNLRQLSMEYIYLVPKLDQPRLLASLTGKPYWKAAGVEEKIDLRIAPATETLQSLLQVSYPLSAMPWSASTNSWCRSGPCSVPQQLHNY